MEETQKLPMAKTGKIIRTSIYTFLQRYNYFTSTAALLAFPFSVSVLFSQACVPSSSSLLLTIYSRLRNLFDAAGFPPSSEFFTILSQKLSQTIFSSILTLPFTLSFLLITKAAIIQALKQNKPTLPLPPSLFSSLLTLYKPLFLTYLCNSFLILSANATVFSLLFFAFNCLEGFGFSSPNCLLFLSAAGAVLYSIILANALIVCSLAMVLSGMERCGGYMAILKACALIRGRTSTALLLALPVNMALASIEALFQFRVVRAYHFAGKLGASMALEGIFIAYLYSIFIVLDTVVICIFFKSCKTGYWIEQEGRYSYRIEFAGEEDSDVYVRLRTAQEHA
ncbi:uncharacterized protein LOC132176122 [Corylus avellana]|uniref:uncharacterized protein LOC132176122 n=1 Tax=Corylus avellana TaxID=13451 RepID=UPI001E20C028|nr:uncharacterized protein LOC132176122 [Corylus avellana]